MIRHYANWLMRYRFSVIFLVLITMLVAASGVRFLQFDTDYRIFFGEDNPQLIAFDELQNSYTKDDNVMFVLTPKSGQVFNEKTMSIVQDLTEKSWQIPYSIRVDSLSNYQHTWVEEDDLAVGDLVEAPSALSPQEWKTIKEIATTEPLLVSRLINTEGTVTAVNITVQLPDDNTQTAVPEVAAFVRNMADELRTAHPDMQVHLTGMVMMNNSFPELSKKDMSTLIPIMFGVVVVTFLLLLHSPWATVGTVLVILFSIATGMGLAGWAGIVLTGPSASAPTIILTMGVADAVHLLVSFFVVYGYKFKEKNEAIIEALRINFSPILLTSVTTAIGFLSMNFSDAPPFRDLGNIVSMGVLAAFVYSVTFLPIFLSLVPVKPHRKKPRTSHMMEILADWVISKRTGLLYGMSSLAILFIAFIPSNQLNDEFVKYFSKNVDFRNATDYTVENLTGIYNIGYSIDSGESSGISDPAFLTNIEKMANWLRTQPEVTHVSTITDIFKRLNKNMHGDNPDWYRLPDDRNMAAQYLLLYEMSLPYGLDLNNQINVDKRKTRLTVTMKSISSNDVIGFADRVRNWMQHNWPREMIVEGASPTVMFAHIGKRNIVSMLGGTTIALFLISLSLILALRSLKIGLLSLIPNLVPAGIAFGLWGMVNGQVGLALSVVTGMTLGIIVDDTVHFLSKYLRARREHGHTAEEAVRYAFSTVGTALWVTTLVLVAGFMVLTMSDFKLNAEMGLMTAMAIAIALIIDFLLLPALLIKLEGNDHA
ncbi:efflux RND transporter permease subunit [Magnetococcus sp. PR-3]|uniref:efflux RND transporter permease subunit n=1 Tax=Magnetococcus sp. PR-3 TaxID=3120355 RepID=UPI002FCE2BBD